MGASATNRRNEGNPSIELTRSCGISFIMNRQGNWKVRRTFRIVLQLGTQLLCQIG
jgi:hypothetical protein